PGAHWVWANDIVFHHMVDGKAFLLDGDSGRMLGMLSTGFNYNGVVIGKAGSELLSPETYFARGTRGARTDVVTFYGGRTLSPTGEVVIPPKRASTMPMLANAPLTDDSRFLLIYNFTPAQSVSVVDVPARKFAGEIEIPGCALIYPTGPRAFFSLCGDGAAMQVQLADDGTAIKKSRTVKLVDPAGDPVTEKGVRDGNGWIFVTFAGKVVRLEAAGGGLRAAESWSLLDAADLKASWRPGGLQHLSLHAATRRLYSLMHIGGDYSHKDPGTEVWVYDVAAKRRMQRIVLKAPATSITVTRDAKPLLFTAFMGASGVNVYDALSGKFLRSISEVGLTPTTLVTY
ncbi:MAG TPA: amine dehydrogenase large subunit, partial [Steroidobacteraceae bacterium]|nr:amine dehydrogenase large subunit [Steroidobacteraceae bacterium]